MFTLEIHIFRALYTILAVVSIILMNIFYDTDNLKKVLIVPVVSISCGVISTFVTDTFLWMIPREPVNIPYLIWFVAILSIDLVLIGEIVSTVRIRNGKFW